MSRVDIKKVKEDLIQWIRDYFEENGKDCYAVLGISGGKDSSICAKLCVEALGAERVFGVMLPNGVQHDIDYSQEIVQLLGIKYTTINISSYANEFEKTVKQTLGDQFLDMSEQAKVNYPARLRMTTLYAVAQSLPKGGRVVCTGNASESLVGYCTKFGDSAGDFSPLVCLTVRELRLLGKELGLPDKFTEKPPEDGLTGLTDEDNLGFSYDDIDNFIENGTSGKETIDKLIAEKNLANIHKVTLMPFFDTEQ